MRNAFFPRAVAATFVLAASIFAQSPTAVIGNDLKELQDAVKAEPQNLGLRMRVAQRQLDMVKDSSVAESKKLIEQIEAELLELKNLSPAFIYPYKALAKGKYRRGDFQGAISVIADYAKKEKPDFELRTFYTNSLLALYYGAVDTSRKPREGEPKQPEGLDPAKLLKDAADYVADWADGDLAPGFGTMFGLFKSWTCTDPFAVELVRAFEERHAKNPKNLTLTVHYASLLMALGRNESAWKILQDAERFGLCDWSNGARHPITYLLEQVCPEQKTPESVSSFDIAEIEAAAQKFPDNVSLTLRAALANKAKAFANSMASQVIEARIKRFTERDPQTDLAPWKKMKEECDADAKKFYAAALPYAEKGNQLSKDVDTIPLILGDLYYKLGRQEEAVAQLTKGVELVPYFDDLREGLANLHRERKDWKACAEQLVVLCMRTSVHTENWDKEVQDSLLPRPKSSRERLLVELMENAESRGPVLQVFEAASTKDPMNPNLALHLAMLHFFAGNKAQSVAAMRRAETAGMCGPDGYPHDLATMIASRTDWK